MRNIHPNWFNLIGIPLKDRVTKGTTPNKYKTHQGNQEIARRKLRLAKAQ